MSGQKIINGLKEAVEYAKTDAKGERCPKCSNYAVFGKPGERVCTVCGAFELRQS